MADAMVTRSTFVDNEVLDLRDEIALVSPTDTPLTTLLMGRGAVVPATDITVTWREKQLNANRGTLKKEGAEAGEAIISSRSSLSNICQIIEKVTKVSGTAQALNPKGIGNSFKAEVNDRLIEVKRDLEWYFLNGVKTVESDDTARQMAGIVNLVNANNVIDSIDKDITEDMLLDMLQKMWEKGAHGEYFTFVNASVKRIINALGKSGTNFRMIEDATGVGKAFGVTFNKFESDFGTLNMVLDRHMDPHTLLAVDLDEVQIAELRGTFYEDLPKAGDYQKGHILNESTIKLLNSYAGAKIINVGKQSS